MDGWNWLNVGLEYSVGYNRLICSKNISNVINRVITFSNALHLILILTNSLLCIVKTQQKIYSFKIDQEILTLYKVLLFLYFSIFKSLYRKLSYKIIISFVENINTFS